MFASFLAPDGIPGRRLAWRDRVPYGPVIVRTRHDAAHAQTLGVLVLTYLDICIFPSVYPPVFCICLLLYLSLCLLILYLAIIDTSCLSVHSLSVACSCSPPPCASYLPFYLSASLYVSTYFHIRSVLLLSLYTYFYLIYLCVLMFPYTYLPDYIPSACLYYYLLTCM